MILRMYCREAVSSQGGLIKFHHMLEFQMCLFFISVATIACDLIF